MSGADTLRIFSHVLSRPVLLHPITSRRIPSRRVNSCNQLFSLISLNLLTTQLVITDQP